MINVRNNESFSYRYSANENKEVQEIRRKYLPPAENKLEELKRLDQYVQTAGQLQSLVIGILGCLVFELGFCLVLEVIGESILLGFLLGIIGMAGMIGAYPVFRSKSKKAKAEYTPRILELADELMIK